MVLFTDDSATDTCDETPLELMFPLPPTCKVNVDDVMVSKVNIGRCKNVPFVTQLPTLRLSDNLYCMPGNTELLQVSCEDFSYEIKQITSCGCAECPYGNIVSVSGRVNTGDAAVTNAYVLYGDVTYDITDSQFFFEATPMGGHVIFQIKSSSFMSQLVTLDTIEGVTQMYVEVTLAAKPTPSVVDVAIGAELEVETPGLPSAVSVIIPQDSFEDKNGDPVSGNVNVFLSFSDPRKSDGLDAAPGQFTFQNSDGETQPLKTFGVLTMEAEDADGNEVFLVGKMTLEVDADALGIELGESVSLWNIDPVSGQWEKSGELTFPERRRRRRQTTPNIMSGESSIRATFPFINFDQPIIDRELLCYVAVHTYYGGDFAMPMAGERLIATMLNENGQPFGQTIATTDQNGRACLGLLCGFLHYIYIVSSEGVIVHTTHYLPNMFQFENTASGFDLIADQVDNDNGPLFRWQWAGNRCLDSDVFHFKLAVPPIRPYLFGSLNAVKSWFPPPPAKWQACAFLVMINVRIIHVS